MLLAPSPCVYTHTVVFRGSGLYDSFVIRRVLVPFSGHVRAVNPRDRTRYEFVSLPSTDPVSIFYFYFSSSRRGCEIERRFESVRSLSGRKLTRKKTSGGVSLAAVSKY